MLRLLSLLLCSCLMFSVLAEAADANWQLSVDRDDIRIWKRREPGSDVMAFRAETTMTTSLSGLMTLFYDIDNAPKWLDHTRRVTALQRDDQNREYVLLMETYMPWPLKDRDAVIVGWWWQDAATGTVFMRGKSAPRGRYPENPDYLRYYDMRSDWSFTPLGNGHVKVVMEGHADPAGSLPTWAVNLLIQESPFKTLRNMRAQVVNDRYQKARFEGIDETVPAVRP